MSPETEAVVAEFVEYWRANYHDGVVIGRAAWHEEKLARVVGRVVATALRAAEARAEANAKDAEVVDPHDPRAVDFVVERRAVYRLWDSREAYHDDALFGVEVRRETALRVLRANPGTSLRVITHARAQEVDRG